MDSARQDVSDALRNAKGLVPPNNIDAERSVIGSMLIDSECISEVMMFLRADDFYMKTHAEIYSAIAELFTTGVPVDIITVSNLLETAGILDKIGGTAYLAEMSANVPTTSNVTYYANIVKERAELRGLITVASTIMKMCYSKEDEARMVKDAARQMIFDLDKSSSNKDLKQVMSVAIEALAALEERFKSTGRFSGIPSGFRALDSITSGFQKANLILIAARPGVGKSALALNIATHVAVKQRVPVAFFSLEMSNQELVNRILCCEAMIDGHKMKDATLSDTDWESISACIAKIQEAPLYLDDTTGISVSDIRAKCQKLKMDKGLGMVVIDYLQLMQGKSRTENRQQEIAEITRGLKLMAKDLEVPVITLSQLSRAAEGRQRPILSDLRESGAIEQDADMVMFISKEMKQSEDGAGQTEDETEPDTIPVELIIAKHRSGSLGSINLNWTGKYTRFDNIDYIRE